MRGRSIQMGQKATLVRRSGEQTAAASRKHLRLGSPCSGSPKKHILSGIMLQAVWTASGGNPLYDTVQNDHFDWGFPSHADFGVAIWWRYRI